MKILMLAPQPFFVERGTPIAVNMVLNALSGAGHTVDLLCFAGGSDVQIPGVRLHRTPCVGRRKIIPPGFSFRKLLCDFLMLIQAILIARRVRPDFVHAVEESVFAARCLKFLFGIPFLYDMDSSVPDQIVEKYPSASFLRPIMHRLFAIAAAPAMMIVPVCAALAEVAATQYRPRRVQIVHDITMLPARAARQPEWRVQAKWQGTTFLYAGNLETYQGVDLMLDAFARHLQACPGDALVIVGGTPERVAHYRARAGELGCEPAVRFLGARPTAELLDHLAAADVLVSPRIHGVNTPMKLYSYLDSGRAVLATRLLTHTQVLTDDVACMSEPDPQLFAEAMTRLSGDPSYRSRLADAARVLVERNYSPVAFDRSIKEIYICVEKELREKVV